MYKILFLALIIAITACDNTIPPATTQSSSGISTASSGIDSELHTLNGIDVTSDEYVKQLYNSRRSDTQVLVRGTIIRILSDDTEGSQHQRFIIELGTGQTLLVAHNIDLAPRVTNIKTDTEVYVYGEYEYNDEGGVVHWTHHDPDKQHVNGWIYYDGEYFG